MERSIILILGVAGSGKTTVGAMLAGRLGWQYADADDFHSAANVEKMAAGHPLTDADRWPWLHAIASWIDVQIASGQPAVVSCSALHRAYRDVMRRPEVQMVYLHGSPDLIAARLTSRQGHFFKREMLDGQFATLQEPEPDENVITVSIEGTPLQVVDRILAQLTK